VSLKSLRIDPFLLAMIATVTAASLLPVRGHGAIIADHVTDAGIALLFFLHGAKLSTAAIRAGIGAYRVHILVFLATFALFPVLGVLIGALGQGHVAPQILTGLIFMTLVPSTVQSSVAFTATAGGNVPAAICSASISNLAGIVLTPLLAAWLLALDHTGAAISFDAVRKIALQLLLPFVAGHLLRPLIGATIDRHRALVGRVDRGSILLVVYTAFSAAVVEGLWHRFGWSDLATIVVIDAILLAVMLATTLAAARLAGLDRAMEIVVLFAGSKKSLASGVPMAGAIFPTALVGPAVMPLMIFHQLQLMVCAALAARYAAGNAQGPDDPIPVAA
jgi:sodium/bile acid cotransporter 7